MDLDLEQYRKINGLSYKGLADLIGVAHKAQARTYALGIRWPEPERVADIVDATNGSVTIEALHRRHLAFVRINRRERANRNRKLCKNFAELVPG